MKKWILAFLKRFIVVLVIVVVIGFLFIWQPYVAASFLAKSQYKQTEALQTQLSLALNAINNTPDLTELIPGIGPGASYRDYIKNNGEKIASVNPSEVPTLNTNAAANRRFQKVRDVNKVIIDYRLEDAYKNAEELIHKSDELFAYHLAVTQALVNIMQYVPELDIKDYNQASQETKDKLDRAEEGLAKAQKQLKEVKSIGYSDPTLTEIMNLITAIQSERDKLAASGDTSRWTMQFNTLRQRILANRQAFWVTETEALENDLASSYEQISSIVRRWLRINQS